MEATPHLLRFRGNQANPNFSAVRHLLSTYAIHLGLDFELADHDAPADIHWDALPVAAGEHDSLILPGRLSANPDLRFGKTRGQFPAPLGGQPWEDRQRGEILDTDGVHSLFRLDKAWISEWDVFSFCADILFKRSDVLPANRDASREGRFHDLPDAELGLDQEPWVDRWMFRLLGLLPQFQAKVAALPGQTSLWLTHDLDNLAKWRLRSVAGQVLRTPLQALQGRFSTAAKNYSEIFTRVLKGTDPFDVMDRVITLEGGRKSACFFLANGLDHLFHRYDLAQPRFLRVLKNCQAAGKDMGLHGQVHFINDGREILAEKNKLERLTGSPVSLNRQHYLRWDARNTYRLLEDAGILVDSTMGYNDTPGFRAGTALPYMWFDCERSRPSRLLIVPLILGEFQFYDPQKFDRERVMAVIRNYLDKTSRHGGVFTVLFHNEYFQERDFPGHADVYRDLLQLADAKTLPDFNPLETHRRYAGIDA